MIVLQLVTTNDISSRLIRYGTWSDYSHVDFVLPNGQLLGAHLNGGVQAREPNYETFTKKLRAVVDAPDHVLVAAMSQIGKKYDWTAITDFVTRKKRNWREDDSWFCSELVAWAFEIARFPILNTAVDMWRITPRDILLSPLVSY